LNPGDGPIVRLTNLTEHTHTIPAGQTDTAGGGSFGLGAVNVDAAGVTDQPARTGTSTALTYFDQLTVLYDGQDITAQLLKQLNGIDPANWPANAKLGDGTNTHAIVVNGTGRIDLTQLGLDFTPGEHGLTFQVSGAGNGGQIKYNLYVA